MPAAERLCVFAPAKINLFLHVGQRRADGYHDLQSLAVFADCGDVLWFRPADEFSLSLTGPFATALSTESDNLVLRAAWALAEHAGVSRGAWITLEKNLPVASGVGGGSADAAATLRGLGRLWNLKIGDEELNKLASNLGADIPACLVSKPLWMEGKGERLKLLARMPGLWMVLVNPVIAVSTAEVFRTLKDRHGASLQLPSGFLEVSSLINFLGETANDLEAPARAIAPEIGEVLDALAKLPGVLLSRMSGSGATCFALFDNEATARRAADRLSTYRDWWVTSVPLADQSALEIQEIQ